IRKEQQNVIDFLEAKKIQYELIDISSPDNEEEKKFMRANGKAKEGKTVPLPPQVFNDEEYCGDFDSFYEAREANETDVFFKFATANEVSQASMESQLIEDAAKEELEKGQKEERDNEKGDITLERVDAEKDEVDAKVSDEIDVKEKKEEEKAKEDEEDPMVARLRKARLEKASDEGDGFDFSSFETKEEEETPKKEETVVEKKEEEEEDPMVARLRKAREEKEALEAEEGGFDFSSFEAKEEEPAKEEKTEEKTEEEPKKEEEEDPMVARLRKARQEKEALEEEEGGLTFQTLKLKKRKLRMKRNRKKMMRKRKKKRTPWLQN
ncbi:hypothetical protein FSP39_005389, partial [Pinctada imbricata]